MGGEQVSFSGEKERRKEKGKSLIVGRGWG